MQHYGPTLRPLAVTATILLAFLGAPLMGSGQEEPSGPTEQELRVAQEQLEEFAQETIRTYEEATEREMKLGYTKENASAIASLSCVLTRSFLTNLAGHQLLIDEAMNHGVPIVLTRDEYSNFVEDEIEYLEKEHELSDIIECDHRKDLWRVFYRNEQPSLPGVFVVPSQGELEPAEYVEGLRKMACEEVETIIEQSAGNPLALRGIILALMDGISGVKLVATNLRAPAPGAIGTAGRILSILIGGLAAYYATDDLVRRPPGPDS